MNRHRSRNYNLNHIENRENNHPRRHHSPLHPREESFSNHHSRRRRPPEFARRERSSLGEVCRDLATMVIDIAEAGVYVNDCYCEIQQQNLRMQRQRDQRRFEFFDRGVRLVNDILDDRDR